MGVSLVGASGSSVKRLASTFTVLGVLGAAGFYLYGPAVTPALQGAAINECNDLMGGNYRSFRLTWISGTQPHWMCSNRYQPGEPAVDMGWWVTPGF
jgi:hypothetical protein